MSYAVILEAMEALTQSGEVLTPEGAKYWVVSAEWVEATGSRAGAEPPPRSLKTWETKREAEAFADRWEGHPWYCKPSGRYEIVAVQPVLESVQVGWRLEQCLEEVRSKPTQP